MNPLADAGFPAFRRRFIAFIRELCAFLGHAAPTLDVSDDEELAVELQVDEVRFFVLHLPQHPARLTAYARVRVLPEENVLGI